MSTTEKYLYKGNRFEIELARNEINIDGEIYYSMEEDDYHYKIVSVEMNNDKLVIPATFKKKPITHIEFSNDNDKIKELVISANIEKIEITADIYSNLKKVTCPKENKYYTTDEKGESLYKKEKDYFGYEELVLVDFMTQNKNSKARISHKTNAIDVNAIVNSNVEYLAYYDYDNEEYCRETFNEHEQPIELVGSTEECADNGSKSKNDISFSLSGIRYFICGDSIDVKDGELGLFSRKKVKNVNVYSEKINARYIFGIQKFEIDNINIFNPKAFLRNLKNNDFDTLLMTHTIYNVNVLCEHEFLSNKDGFLLANNGEEVYLLERPSSPSIKSFIERTTSETVLAIPEGVKVVKGAVEKVDISTIRLPKTLCKFGKNARRFSPSTRKVYASFDMLKSAINNMNIGVNDKRPFYNTFRMVNCYERGSFILANEKIRDMLSACIKKDDFTDYYIKMNDIWEDAFKSFLSMRCITLSINFTKNKTWFENDFVNGYIKIVEYVFDDAFSYVEGKNKAGLNHLRNCEEEMIKVLLKIFIEIYGLREVSLMDAIKIITYFIVKLELNEEELYGMLSDECVESEPLLGAAIADYINKKGRKDKKDNTDNFNDI